MASPPSRNVIKSRAHPEVGGKSSKTFHVERRSIGKMLTRETLLSIAPLATEIVSESSTTDVSRLPSFSGLYSTNIKWKSRKSRKTTRTKRIMDKRRMKKKLRMRIRTRMRKVTEKAEEPRVEIDHEAESTYREDDEY
ncbi:hypothetical protein FRB91_002263 [Serendipita sp. 411]|nr:hypothetical protein FRB91_002263 [Serendipita sp. 411]